jgi:dUTP pyrophosphatase
MDWRMESGERLYRARAYAHFSGGSGATVNTRGLVSGMKRYDSEFNMRIRIKRLSPDASLPEYAHGPLEDAGMDLRAVERLTLQPNAPRLVPTGLSIELPPGYEAQIRPRSGLALKHAITVPNAPATIDPGYRGEIKVILLNLGTGGYTIEKHDRIAQMVIARYEAIEWEEGELADSARGEGGFGSSGR